MFEKKTWKDRITQYPARRKLINVESGEESTVDVSRDEGNISSAGTPFSATNMNDLENRIYKMFPCSISNGGTGGSTATTARKNLDVMHATFLYDNYSGTNTTVTLSDSANNYVFLDIHYMNDDQYNSTVRTIRPTNKYTMLMSMQYSPSEQMMYFKSAVIYISGTTLNFLNTGWMYSSSSSTTVKPDSKLKITRVLGYNY
nr:MAG TPA: hypothetical protein [Bacteriophage sp.]